MKESILTLKTLVISLIALGVVSFVVVLMIVAYLPSFSTFALVTAISSVSFFVFALEIKRKRLWAFLAAAVFFVVIFFNIMVLILLNLSSVSQVAIASLIPIFFIYFLAFVFRREKINREINKFFLVFIVFATANLIFGIFLLPIAYQAVVASYINN